MDVLRGTEGAASLDRVDVVQPALWAVMVSLAALWESLGIRPSAVVGHSQGEIAAACVAGALTLEDAARVVALRSRALIRLAGTGGMVSLPLPADEAEQLLAAWPGQISVAAHNGPASTVVAGDTDALDALLAACEHQDVRARRIDVDYASHSAHVESLRDELLELLEPVRPRAGRIPLHSTLEDRLIDGSEMDAEYWHRNLRHTVRFEPAVRALAASGHTVFVECSPHPVLTVGVQDTLAAAAADEAVVTGTLRREDGGPARVLTSLGRLVAHGVRPDWAAVFAGRPQERVALPTYPFQGERYWLEPVSGVSDPSAVGQHAAGHPLLGAAVALPDRDGLLLTGLLSLKSQPWLGDHAVGGTVFVPGTALLELAVRAGDEAGCGALGDLTLEAPLVLPERGETQLRVLVDAPGEDGLRPVAVYSRPADALPEDPWTRHATGVLTPRRPGASRRPHPVAAARCGSAHHRDAVRGPRCPRPRLRARLPRPAVRLAAGWRALRRGRPAPRSDRRGSRVRAAPGPAGRGAARHRARHVCGRRGRRRTVAAVRLVRRGAAHRGRLRAARPHRPGGPGRCRLGDRRRHHRRAGGLHRLPPAATAAHRCPRPARRGRLRQPAPRHAVPRGVDGGRCAEPSPAKRETTGRCSATTRSSPACRKSSARTSSTASAPS
ncbi:hypothetical protein GCM10020000_52860 [Streptomyces olivoverticillatus]